MITYKEAEEYILDIPKFAGKNTVEDTGRLLTLLTGSMDSKIIHVAGTNGKGSVCACHMDNFAVHAACKKRQQSPCIFNRIFTCKFRYI